MKTFFYFLFIFIIQFPLLAKNFQLQKNEKPEKQTYLDRIKFRGSVALPLAYYFPVNPVTITNNAGLTDYSFDYDYTDDNDSDFEHHDKDDPGRRIKSIPYKIETQIESDFSIIFPITDSNHFLLNDSNFNLKFLLNLSPVTLSGGINLILTPLPFLVFDAGTQLGSGWNITSLNIFGMARINYSGNDPTIAKTIAKYDHFFGPVMQNWFSAALQFDLSFAAPQNWQNWLHIIAFAKAKFNNTQLLNYLYFNRPYYWKTSSTLNGWNLISTFALGYIIPITSDERKQESEQRQFRGFVRHNDFSIIILMWTDLNIRLSHYGTSKINDKGWGSDFPGCIFGPNIVFNLPNNFSVFAGLHWKNSIHYSSDTIGNADFMKREYDNWYVYFYRTVITVKWIF